jgi:hypothetical protein
LGDPTISEFSLETNDPTHEFDKFLSLGRGCTLSFSGSGSDESRSVIELICNELENEEVLDILSRESKDELTIHNVLGRLNLRYCESARFKREIAFAASHFSELTESDLLKLKFELIYRIMADASLKVVDEDSLCRFVMNRVLSDVGNCSLFEFVRFEYVSSEVMEDFFTLMSNDLNDFISLIWPGLHNRLVLPVSPKSTNDRLLTTGESDFSTSDSVCCAYRSDAPLKGIISFLTEKFGGNVHDRDIVALTASSILNSSYGATKIVDGQSQTFFHSVDQPNQWVCLDFKNMKIEPTHYSIETSREGNNDYLLLSDWLIEGSDDGATWIELDRHENDRQLSGPCQTVTFSVSQSSEIRFFRIRQIGLNRSGSNYLSFSRLEIFGKIQGVTN